MTSPNPVYDVDVHLNPVPTRPHLLARASFSHGMIRVHGVMIHRERGGRLRVLFPDKAKLVVCPACETHVGCVHPYCFGCGAPLPKQTPAPDHKGRVRRFSETAHPIGKEARGLLSTLLLEAYLAKIGVRPAARLFVPGAAG